MKIILLRDIARMGQRGEVKEIADGYAMNVLIKKGDAVQATPGELAKWKAKEDSTKRKKELATSTFLQLTEKLRTEKLIIIGKKADTKGQLFAQIKDVDIADAIFKATACSVDPKQITIPAPIKSLGVHTVELKQGAQKEKVTLEVK